MIWKFCFEEMSKNAGLIMNSLIGAASAYDVGSTSKTMGKKMLLSKNNIGSQYKIRGGYNRQFTDGKHTDLASTQTPHLSLYS